jgi:hypothetical protein
MLMEIGRGVDIDLFEKAHKFLMPMAWHTVADHLAVEHVKGGNQCGSAVGCVGVCHLSTTAFLEQKTRFGAIEVLDWTFLIDAQHKKFVREIKIPSDEIVQLLCKVWVAAELEGLYEIELEVVSPPNTLNAYSTDTLGLRHAADVLMDGIGRYRVQDDFNDRATSLGGNARDAAYPVPSLLAADPKKWLWPEPDPNPGNSQFPSHVLPWDAIGRYLTIPANCTRCMNLCLPRTYVAKVKRSPADNRIKSPVLRRFNDRFGGYVCQAIYGALH